jgi:ribosomal protein L7/L12
MDYRIILVVIGFVLIAAISSAIDQLRNDIRRTNSILEKIAIQIGVPETPVDDEVKTFIAQGNKIKAIKRYREITGVGLKEAKEYIDKLV